MVGSIIVGSWTHFKFIFQNVLCQKAGLDGIKFTISTFFTFNKNSKKTVC